MTAAALPDTRIIRDGDHTIAFSEYGDPNGRLLFQLHGQPGSRFQRYFDESVYARAGVRVVMIDRAGYGKTTRRPGHAIGDCAADVVAVADALGRERFAVFGPSLGAAHTLAVAALHPDRVAVCAAAVPYAPPEAPIDHVAGMVEYRRIEREIATRGEDAIRAHLAPKIAGWLEAIGRGELPFPVPPPAVAVFHQWMPEAFAQGDAGYVDDQLAIGRPWGFDLADIRARTLVFVAKADDLVPPQNGRWVAEHVRGAERIDLEGGHLAFIARFGDVLSRIVAAWP